MRREEVAELAGISTAWYTYLEQGRNVHISRGVLESLANALQLSNDERIHLSWLADQPLPPDPLPLVETMSPVYQRSIDAMEQTPAYIMGRRTNLLGWNKAARLVFGDFAAFPEEERNLLWLLFTNSAFRQRFPAQEAFALDALKLSWTSYSSVKSADFHSCMLS